MSDSFSYTSPQLAREDVEDAPAAGTKSVYDNLLAEISTPAQFEETKIIKIPGRDKVALKINTRLPLQRLTTLRKIARTNKKSDEIDLAMFNARLIVAQTQCLQFNGQDAIDRETGELVDFRNPQLQDSLKAMEASAAVQALVPRDADLLTIGGEILDACGYGEQEDDEDPLDYENV